MKRINTNVCPRACACVCSCCWSYLWVLFSVVLLINLVRYESVIVVSAEAAAVVAAVVVVVVVVDARQARWRLPAAAEARVIRREEDLARELRPGERGVDWTLN